MTEQTKLQVQADVVLGQLISRIKQFGFNPDGREVGDSWERGDYFHHLNGLRENGAEIPHDVERLIVDGVLLMLGISSMHGDDLRAVGVNDAKSAIVPLKKLRRYIYEG